MATKLSDALSIKTLKVTHPIYREKDGTIVNKLQEAIDDGSLKALADESAANYCNGDITAVVKALKACLSSYKVNIKKAAGPIDLAIEQMRIETLTKWLESFGKAAPSRKEVYGRVENGKPKWDVSAEDIVTLVNSVGSTLTELENCYNAICSIYNCIASKLSKDLVGAEIDLKVCGNADPAKKAALEERVKIKNRIMEASAECAAQKVALRKRIAAVQTLTGSAPTPEAVDKLIGKLKSDKKVVTLSRREKEMIAELLLKK